jgi:hypothetical protein
MNGQMVCVCCGGFSSAQVCWQCGHLKQQIAEACAEKDKRIAELEARLTEATGLIKHFGWTSSEWIDVIENAEKWLKGKS